MTIWAVLPAAGIGRRMGSNIPKQYLPIDGVPLILHSLRRLAGVTEIQQIAVVLHPEDQYWAELSSSIESEFGDRLATVMGANERHRSVLNGLNYLGSKAQADDWVLVHDAVRPCVRVQDIENLITAVREHSIGGLLGYPIDNTLKHIDDTGAVIKTVDRRSYWNALTPQMFRYSKIKAAYESVVDTDMVITDEAAAIEHAGHKPLMVLGNKDNIKITHATDLLLAAQILQAQVSSDEC